MNRRPFDDTRSTAHTALPTAADPYVLHGEATASVAKIKLKFGETFLVADTRGDLPLTEQDTGLYWHGMRMLRTADLYVSGVPWTGLSHSISDEEGMCHIDLTNPALSEENGAEALYGVAHLRRRLILRGRTMIQLLTLTSYNDTPLEITLGLLLGADFRDIFEIRGFQRKRAGQIDEPKIAHDAIIFGYLGADDVARETRIEFDPPATDIRPVMAGENPRSAGATAALWRITLRDGAPAEVRITTRLWEGSPKTPEIQRWPESKSGNETSLRQRQLPTLVSDNTFFNHLLMRGIHDLTMMCARTPQGLYPYGGIPWYVCPFGRDGLITSLEFLPWFPDIARGTLTFLAARQGQNEDAFTEEQPGKILHELRSGELANLREIPFIPYYGTVDATPLFLILLERYIRWTNDMRVLQRLWPNALAAANWIVTSGDRDGDGFIEYQRSSSAGLVNQGWKDSWDAISHADGKLAEGPITLCEAQAYAYAAFHAIAYLADRLEIPDERDRWLKRAERLREAFSERFWWPDEGTYYLALDGAKNPCKVVASNAGHCLWAGIASADQAESVVKRLMSPDLYTEWGIRTLSSQAARYNPMSYHNGSVWPHDTAMIGSGFARYGYSEEAARLLGNLYGVSLHYEGARLPELFCGFTREYGYAPTSYPVACSPQSWAAGAPFLLLSALLGFQPDAEHGKLMLRRPALPDWLSRLEMHGLRVGGQTGRLRFEQAGNETAVVLSRHSEIDIQVLPQ
ncbi:MAG TPA: glycogen debranching N-terminal domain-containing protein [Ktedonobacterales bacterium]